MTFANAREIPERMVEYYERVVERIQIVEYVGDRIPHAAVCGAQQSREPCASLRCGKIVHAKVKERAAEGHRPFDGDRRAASCKKRLQVFTGRDVVVTGDRDQALEIEALLRREGADVGDLRKIR